MLPQLDPCIMLICVRPRFICCRVNGDTVSGYAVVCVRVHTPVCAAAWLCACARACVCVGKGQRDTVLHITALQMAVVSGCDSESE